MIQKAAAPSRACPKCGSMQSGRFCSECGLALTPGVTWAHAGAVLAVGALVVIVLAQSAKRAGSPPPADQSLAPGVVPAPNIDNMSPPERAARLYDRVMRLHEERKMDSVQFFAPMALAAYAAIDHMDADARYDAARLAMVAGQPNVARAQADTILRADSTHLLGLILSADLSRANNDVVTASRLEAKILASASRERARNLPEYTAHGSEIESVLARLRRSSK